MLEKTTENLVEKIKILPLVPFLAESDRAEVFDENNFTCFRISHENGQDRKANTKNITNALYEVGASLINSGLAYQYGDPLVSKDGRMKAITYGDLNRYQRVQRYRLLTLYHAIPESEGAHINRTKQLQFVLKVALEHLPVTYIARLYGRLAKETEILTTPNIIIFPNNSDIYDFNTINLVALYISVNERLFIKYGLQVEPRETLLRKLFVHYDETRTNTFMEIWELNVPKALSAIKLPLLPKTKATTSSLLSTFISFITTPKTEQTVAQISPIVAPEEKLIPILAPEQIEHLFDHSLSKINYLHSTDNILQVLYHTGSLLVNSGGAYHKDVRVNIGGQFIDFSHYKPLTPEQQTRRAELLVVYQSIPQIIADPNNSGQYITNPDLALFTIMIALDHMPAHDIERIAHMLESPRSENKQAEDTLSFPDGSRFMNEGAIASIFKLYMGSHKDRFNPLPEALMSYTGLTKKENYSLYGIYATGPEQSLLLILGNLKPFSSEIHEMTDAANVHEVRKESRTSPVR